MNTLVLLVVLTPLAYIGYRAMFSNLSSVDDEGYVLISMREWFDGASLYGEVYSQYGPALYALVAAPLGALDLLDTDGAKATQLVIWLTTSLLAGLTLLRITRNLPVAAVGLALTFFVLMVDVGEPLHPGGLICLLLTGIVAAAAFLLPERPGLAMFAMGALVATIGLLKGNIGGLALIAVVFAVAVTGQRSRERRSLGSAACAAFVLVPFVLIASDLSQFWGLRYAAIVGIGALAICVSATALPPSRVNLEGRWRSLILGLAAPTALVLGVAILTGSGPGDLVRGIVLDPLEFNELVDFSIELESLGLLWGATWLVLAGIYRYRLAGAGEWTAKQLTLVGLLSIVAGLAIWVSLAEVPGYPGLRRSIWLGAPLLWLVAVRPPDNASAAGSFLRALVPALALLQLLHAYPVPGSQIGWSEFLLVLAGGIAIADGIDRLPTSEQRHGFGWLEAGAALIVLFAAWFALSPLRDFHRGVGGRYNAAEGLELSGATHLRLDPAQRRQLRDVARDLSNRCESFISLPGMNSFYLWTETDPPTQLNAGAWPWLLDAERQQQVVDSVQQIDSLCVLRSEFVLGFWEGVFGAAPKRPLLRYIKQGFVPVRSYPGILGQDLELLERRQDGASATGAAFPAWLLGSER